MNEETKTDEIVRCKSWLDEIVESKQCLFIFGLIGVPVSIGLIVQGYTLLIDGIKCFHFFHYNSFIGNIFDKTNGLELWEVCTGSMFLIIGMIIFVSSVLWILNGIISFSTKLWREVDDE